MFFRAKRLYKTQRNRSHGDPCVGGIYHFRFSVRNIWIYSAWSKKKCIAALNLGHHQFFKTADLELLYFSCKTPNRVFLLWVFNEMKSSWATFGPGWTRFQLFLLHLYWTWSSSLCRLSTSLHLFQGSSSHLLQKQPYGVSYFPISQHSKCLADIWATAAVRHRDGMNLPKWPHLPQWRTSWCLTVP